MKTNPIQPLFSQNTLDRMDHLRANILTSRLTNLDTERYLLLSKGNIMLGKDGQSCFFTGTELFEQHSEEQLNTSTCVFLGGKEGLHYYTLGISAEAAEDFESIPMRTFVQNKMLPDEDLGILAEANSLLSWHGSHGFCARCGHKSEVAHGGWRRDCPACEAEHFPRTDPVVIMLVTYGDECLIGRGHNFNEKMFSCLAGFMEPGETIAQAALRELWEEAGIVGGEVNYIVDQPWPFPSNLMIGVHIQAKSKVIKVDYNELAEVIWASKADVKAVLAGDESKSFLLPSREAIARDLLISWV